MGVRTGKRKAWTEINLFAQLNEGDISERKYALL
jgi:hypothetical protein